MKVAIRNNCSVGSTIWTDVFSCYNVSRTLWISSENASRTLRGIRQRHWRWACQYNRRRGRVRSCQEASSNHTCQQRFKISLRITPYWIFVACFCFSSVWFVHLFCSGVCATKYQYDNYNNITISIVLTSSVLWPCLHVRPLIFFKHQFFF